MNRLLKRYRLRIEQIREQLEAALAENPRSQTAVQELEEELHAARRQLWRSLT